MADLPGTDPAKPPPQLQTRTATTRKHLRRDQALSRKSKGKVVATDSIKERQVRRKLCRHFSLEIMFCASWLQ